MPSKFDRNNLLLLIIFSVLITSALAYKKYRTINKIYFVVELQSSSNGNSQIYFDKGYGIREQDSRNLKVKLGGFHKYSFHVPSLLKSIRFDPINKPSVISIKNAGIENANGDKIKLFPVESFKPVQQISRVEVNKDVLDIHTTKTANDPILEIENSSVFARTSWVSFVSKYAWIYVGYAFLSFIILMGLVKLIHKVAYFLDWFVNFSKSSPKTAITLVGFFATILSCYPIIFFGKSFAHPAGVAALYSVAPWIPGLSANAIIENFRGSDVGATSWCIAPNSVVQHDSIFRHFEFPFWNRYVGGGIPLFGQGQSMIGDILHWLPVSLAGSSIGWDLKFLLSRAIFAVGMGLLVYRLTNTLLAGALIAISSCFLGFFALRFNHPAYFVLTYTPWVILQWDRLGSVLRVPDPFVRSCIFQSLLLVVFSWFQLNSGAPKEGVITACFIHAFGGLSLLMQTAQKWGWIRSFALVCGIGFALAMITAPYWLIFLDTLGKSYTLYDTPAIDTSPAGMIIGFFDNYFFQKYLGNLSGPSVNLFVLFCMAISLLSLHIRQSSMVYCGWGLFSLALATAYGLIPSSILIVIPFINKIKHIGNTFSMPMLVFALLLAGYGIRDYLEAPEKFKRILLFFSLITFLVLWLLYAFNGYGWMDTFPFFALTIAIILIAYGQLNHIADSRELVSRRGLMILIFCFLALHIRHGMHLMTGFKGIDDFLINPTERPNFSNKSDAIEYIKSSIDNTIMPTRVVGEGLSLFPGYNTRLGLEGIVPVDAIQNKHYKRLLEIIDYPVPEWAREWKWLRIVESNQITSHAASLDILGIGYIVSEVGTLMPQGMKLVHSSDLDVWKRESVWPRAFFVNHVIQLQKSSDILRALADKSRVPFAAVEPQYIPKQILTSNASYQVLPAKEYMLTNNSTHFTVEANEPGMIVLGETYYQGDFVATLNGEEVDYIRVNEASKGIWVNKVGKYNVGFTYRPEKLNTAISLCLLGLVLLLSFIVIIVRSSGSRVVENKIGEA